MSIHRYLSEKNKHKNFGQVGTIKLEQLDRMILSLKTYWNCDSRVSASTTHESLTSTYEL